MYIFIVALVLRYRCENLQSFYGDHGHHPSARESVLCYITGSTDTKDEPLQCSGGDATRAFIV